MRSSASDRMQFACVVADACQHVGDILADAAPLMRARVDEDAVESEPASLETIERIDEVIVLFRRGTLFHHNVARHRLDVAGDGRGDLHRERGIAHPDFNGAEFRFWTNIPVKILHRFHHAGARHFREKLFELLPA